MKIINGYPPNINEIRQRVTIGKYTVFTYGDTIYNPGNWPLSPDLKVHEGAHEVQQGANPEQWWKRYLEDRQFRLAQELEAYRIQWKFYKDFANRQQKREFLKKISGDLSSKMYGNIISRSEALDRILAD